VRLVYSVKYIQACGRLCWKGEVSTRIWWECLRERNYLSDIRVDGNIILNWIFKK